MTSSRAKNRKSIWNGVSFWLAGLHRYTLTSLFWTFTIFNVSIHYSDSRCCVWHKKKRERIICLFRAALLLSCDYSELQQFKDYNFKITFDNFNCCFNSSSLQSSDLGSHVVTLTYSFLTAAAGRRNVTHASVSTGMFTVPRLGIREWIVIAKSKLARY